MLIAVSDGGDNASKTKLEDVLTRVHESDATVYTVALVDPLMRDGSNPKLLRRLARETGGEFYYPRRVGRHLGGVSKHRQGHSQRLHHRVHADEGRERRHAGRRRTVRVYVRSQDGRVLRVRTRDGYFQKTSEERQ